jgi:NAD+ kinase
VNKVGICYHNKSAEAANVAKALSDALSGVASESWLCQAWDDETLKRNIDGTDLLISAGGDGTILWAARSALTHGIPVLGVRLGILAFLAELSASEALERIPTLLQSESSIEERTTLQTEIASPIANAGPFHAINDVVVSRGAIGRPISLRVSVDSVEVASLRSDGVIIATATGSTAYSLAVGGPVLPPEASELVLNFVAPHMTVATALVLPATAAVEVQIGDDDEAFLSVDGQIDRPLVTGEVVRVVRGKYLARFLRTHTPGESYRKLGATLGWLPRNLE